MHHHHANLLHFFHNKELDELYLSVFIKSIADSLVGIFVPIYLLTLGYSINYVALYYLLYYAAVGLLMPHAVHLLNTLGVKKTMVLGIFFSFVQYMVLANLRTWVDFVAAALLLGMAVSIYYAAFNVNLAKFTDSKTTAVEISFLKIVVMISSALGPLLGALMISLFGFSDVFFGIGIILTFSTLPLLFSKDYHLPVKVEPLKKIMRSDKFSKALAYAVGGFIGVAAGIFWPIYIYLNLLTIESLGIIISATSLLMMFITFGLGKISDKHHESVLKTGIFASCVSWVSRLSFLSPIGLFLNNFFAGISGMLIEIPFSRIVFSQAKKSKNIITYFLFREYWLEAGRLFVLVIAALTGSIFWLFICASILSLSYIPLLKHHKKPRRLFH